MSIAAEPPDALTNAQLNPAATLGRGYDITKGAYAAWQDLKYDVVDVAACVVKVDPKSDLNNDEIQGESSTAVKQHFAAHLHVEGGIGGFSAAVDATFGSGYEHQVDRAFYSHWSQVITHELMLPAEVPVTGEFKRACTAAAAHGLPPFEFFEKWGTHYVQGAIMGGRWVQGMTTLRDKTFSQQEFAATAKAHSLSYSASGDVTMTSTSTSRTYQCSKHLAVRGGDAKGRDTKADFEKWTATVAANAELIDFKPDGGLRPIWELCPDAEYQKKLKAALPTYMSPPLHLTTFRATGHASIHPTVDLVVPQDYKILGGGVKTIPNDGRGQYLTESYPVSASQWHGEAKDHARMYKGGVVSAFAIAIYDPKGALNVTVTKSESATSSSSPHALVKIPADAKLTGGGAKAASDGGPGMLLYASRPEPEEEEHPTAWKAVSNDLAEPDTGKVTAYAISVKIENADAYPARRVVGLSTHVKTDNTGTRENQPDKSVKPQGTIVGGGGRTYGWTDGGNVLVSSYPDAGMWRATGSDFAGREAEASKAKITCSAIGLKLLTDPPS